MKFMKLTVLATFLFSSALFANEVQCEFKTSYGEMTAINHVVSDEGHGPMSEYNSDEFTGMVTSSKGYLVLNIVHRDSKQTSSVHGKVTEDAILGGIVSSLDDWVQYSCSKVTH